MGCLKITYQQEVRQLGENHFFLGECLEKGVTDEKKGTNLYPFGSVASHWEKEAYRFGYQGQFAEEDEETGFNHFELREYDSKIGRFNTYDPYNQFASPYMGMGNNPINGADPDGGFWEWNLNTKTGDVTQIGDKGGDQTQYIHFDGAQTPSSVIQASGFFVGPARIPTTDQWQFTVSKYDLWSSVPTEYLGHYTSIDLNNRYRAFATNSQYTKNILDGEAAGLDRSGIWMNGSDYGRYLTQRYGSKSGYVLAIDNDMVPIPAGGKIGTLRKAHSYLAKWHSRLKPTKFDVNPRGKNSTNPWIRHVQNSKGKFGGSNYMKDLKRAYYGN